MPMSGPGAIPVVDSTGYSSEGSMESLMHGEFTAIYGRDGNWYIPYCLEVPRANGQGPTKERARRSLAEATVLILEDRQEDGLRCAPPDAERETITVEICGAA